MRDVVLQNNRLAMEKAIKKTIKSLVVSIVVFMTLFLMLSIYAGYRATNPERIKINHTPQDYGMTFENISVGNKTDSTRLSGWWIPAKQIGLDLFKERKVVIFSHGYGYNRQNMPFDTLELAKKIHSEGYDIIMFDFRNSGKSEKSSTTIGYKEKSDLLSIIQYVKKEKNIKNIALMGWSMGAATSIIAGAEVPEVKAVIADSSFSNLETYSEESIQYWTGLPKPIGELVLKTAEIFYPELKPKKVKPALVARDYNNKGLFLIHSKGDKAIPYEESITIEKNNKNAETWFPKKGGHIRSYNYQKKEYQEKVLQFLEEYLHDKPIMANIGRA